MPEPSLDVGTNDNEMQQEVNDENVAEDRQDEDEAQADATEVDKDLDAEPRASPTARPQSRGSISTAKKTISRIGSAQSAHFTRPATSLSTRTSESAKTDRHKEQLEEDSDAGYDTDLEIKADKEEYDATGKTAYKDACKQCGVIPVSYFLRHMQDSEMIMKHHGLGAAGAKAIAISLVSNTKILKLDLSDNWINPEGGVAIANMLKENCYITELILSDNHLQTTGAQAICATLQENTNVTRLTLSGNDFDDSTAVSLSEIILSTQRLEQLDLSHNNFSGSGGAQLGHGIAENTSIKDLDLSWNHFRRDGAVAIARGIGANIFLKKVDISWNGFGLEGAIALGEALTANNVLEELDVSNNRFNPEAAIYISKGLSSNETLRILKIGKNPLQSAGAFAVLTALQKNTGSAMEVVDFAGVVVNKDYTELEKEVKEIHPKLVIVHGGAERTERIKPKPRLDPMTKLRNYMEENNLRLVDFFNQFDQDHSMSVTREEFKMGIETAGIMLTTDEMMNLLDQLDKDGDGEINFSELVIGSLEHLQKEKQKREHPSPVDNS